MVPLTIEQVSVPSSTMVNASSPAAPLWPTSWPAGFDIEHARLVAVIEREGANINANQLGYLLPFPRSYAELQTTLLKLADADACTHTVSVDIQHQLIASQQHTSAHSSNAIGSVTNLRTRLDEHSFYLLRDNDRIITTITATTPTAGAATTGTDTIVVTQPKLLEISVKDSRGGLIHFRAGYRKPLSKLMSTYASQRQWPTDDAVFTFNGREIGDIDTPQSIGLQHKDTILVKRRSS